MLGIEFLYAFNMACDITAVVEGAEVSLVLHSVKEMESTELASSLCMRPKSSRRKTKEDLSRTYSQVISHLLKTYSIDDVTAETNNSMLFLSHRCLRSITPESMQSTV